MKSLLLLLVCFSATFAYDIVLDFNDPAACGPAGVGPAAPMQVYADPPQTIQTETFNYSDPTQEGFLPDRLCKWQITGDAALNLTLRFFNFSMEACSECGCDYVKVFDGLDGSDPDKALTAPGTSHNKICGGTNPTAAGAYVSTTNTLYVEFGSDSSVQDIGMMARVGFEYANTACPGPMLFDIDSPSNAIMNAGYPVPYDNDATCRWEITAPVGQRVRLEFVDFGTEDCCTCDWVEVYDDTTSMVLFFGDITPAVATTSTNKMVITMNTDVSVRGNGFFATYSFVV